jgi:hypothetical protein
MATIKLPARKSAPLSEDLLDGAKAFAQFVYGKTDQRTMRRVFHELSKGYLPATKIGARYVGRKSLVTARLSQIDAQSAG